MVIFLSFLIVMGPIIHYTNITNTILALMIVALFQVGGDPEKTREEILSLIAHHVTAVNYIYRDTKFDGRVEHRNIKFEVQRIKVRFM